MGLRSKISRERRRNLVIHSGSFFSLEISSTTAALRPFLGSNTECDGSCQPNLY